MKLQYKTRTEQGKVEITHREDISMDPWNIELKGVKIEKVKMIKRNGCLFISARAWQLSSIFPQLKAAKRTAEVNIEVLDLNGNPVKAYNLLNVRSNSEFTLDKLAYRPEERKKTSISKESGTRVHTLLCTL